MEKKKKGGYRFKKSESDNEKKRLIVILENASLETVKVRNGSYELLNPDDHMHILKKMNRDWNEVRPDITHQVYIYIYFLIYIFNNLIIN